MNELLNDIKFVLARARHESDVERRIQLEIAGHLMRQYQALLEAELGIGDIRCGHCGRYECSH
jgi:hypothetical protein